MVMVSELGQLPFLLPHAVVDDGHDGPLHELDGGNLKQSSPVEIANISNYQYNLKYKEIIGVKIETRKRKAAGKCPTVFR